MVWDFAARPELPNSQMAENYWSSPHKQLVEDFDAKVVRVHDGDTITLQIPERDFAFPLRMLDIDARELNEGGEAAGNFLRERIEGQDVQIKMNRKNRVGKFGRLLGKVVFAGVDMNEEMIRTDNATPFGRRREGLLPDLNKELSIKKWF